MKHYKEISPKEIDGNIFNTIGDQWFLICAGDESGYNMMTASWGGMGVMWAKNVALCVIRPPRHTFSFMENSLYYTLSFFDEKHRDALKFCGAKSGRNYDKAKETGLTPIFFDNTVSFAQAELILVCKKLYADFIRPECFIDSALSKANYPNNDFHKVYTGEIVKVYNTNL